MGKNVIRVAPKSFEGDWYDDFQSLGIKIPKTIPTLVYTPVNHDPMPFSLEVNLNSMRITRRIVGVIPNATYNGHIYSWQELCELVKQRKGQIKNVL